MGYSFEIHYKQGKENHDADALSRVSGSELLAITLTQANFGFYDSIKLLWQSDPSLNRLISELQRDVSSHPKYSLYI